jgi:hypothetical protein
VLWRRRRLGTPPLTTKAMDYVAVQKSGDINDPRAEGAYQERVHFQLPA